MTIKLHEQYGNYVVDRCIEYDSSNPSDVAEVNKVLNNFIESTSEMMIVADDFTTKLIDKIDI